MSCFHVFCKPCLEKQLEHSDPDGDHDSIAEGTGIQNDTLKCTQCNHITVLTNKGVEHLPLDTVMVNILDMAAMNDPQIVCTTCNAREKAVMFQMFLQSAFVHSHVASVLQTGNSLMWKFLPHKTEPSPSTHLLEQLSQLSASLQAQTCFRKCALTSYVFDRNTFIPYKLQK